MKVQGPGPVHAPAIQASARSMTPDAALPDGEDTFTESAPRDPALIRHGSNALRLADRASVVQTMATPMARELERVGASLNSLGTVLGPACLGASALGLSSSLQSLRQGQKVDGALGIASSTASLVGSVAATGQAYDLAASAAFSMSLGPVAAVGAAVAAGLEGARETHGGLREGDVHRVSSGGIKSLGGSLMTYGAMHAQTTMVASGAALFLGGVAYSFLRRATSPSD